MVTTRVSIPFDNFIEWSRAHVKLVEVMKDVLRFWPKAEAYVTSFNRLKAEDAALKASGVHSDGPPWRAIDLRVITLGPNYQQTADDVAAQTNKEWIYDPDRPTLNVAVARPHGSGPHIHIQVCNKTCRRKKPGHGH